MWIRNKLLTLIVLAAIGLAPTGVYAETLVDTKLALMIDVSASVDQNEYWLQLGGYVGAFDSASPSSAAVVNAIQGGQYGSIAVSVVLWSGEGQQTALDFGGGSYWYNVYDTESADNLADAISDAFLGWGKRPYSGLTDIAGAIDFGVDLFNLDSGFTSTRNVMDISGDGKQNVRRDGNWYYETLSQSRADALAAGIILNGLPIDNWGSQTIFDYYSDYVIGDSQGVDDSFAIAANFFNFGTALQQKLVTEITSPPAVPEPSTLLLFGTGIFGMAWLQRRKRYREKKSG